MPIKTKPEGLKAVEAPGQPFSTCVQVGKHFHFSGVVAINMDKNPVGNFEEQTIEVLQKMRDLLRLASLTPNDVFKATVMLAGDMRNYDVFNEHWGELFSSSAVKPARKAFAVTELPFGCAVEIEFEAIDQSED